MLTEGGHVIALVLQPLFHKVHLLENGVLLSHFRNFTELIIERGETKFNAKTEIYR
jgi:hypothetical protein